MTRPRNNFSIPKGDYAIYAVLTQKDMTDLASDLGARNNRYQKFLRRFCLPFTNGKQGNDFAWLVKMPSIVLDRAPQKVQNALKPFFTENRNELAKQYPWIDEANGNHQSIDAVVGSELRVDENRNKWDVS